MPELHRLLLRQLRKYQAEYVSLSPDIQQFILAVNQSYFHFEASHQLVERAMRLSSDELSETNHRLRLESERQQLILRSLKEAIQALSPDQPVVEDNDLLRIVDILHEEIEKRRKLEIDLVRARQTAEYSLKTKQIFLANISHEIRTPINAIVGMSGLLKESRLTGTQIEYLQAICTSAESLMVIVGDLLDMSKLESGKFTLEHITFRPDQLVRNLLNVHSLRAEEKGIRLILDFDKKVADHLVGDPTRINQVLSNLVSNAIKFTGDGEVRLEIRVQKSTRNSQTILFQVKDTGKGISEEKIDSIFEHFEQEDASITRKYGGTGLGLSISKQILEMMGGTIDAQSVKGRGSTFSFTLVLPKGRPLQDKTVEPNQLKNLRSARILIVDDNDLNRYVVTSLLRNWKCITDFAGNGVEALEKLKRKSFDLVLLDLQMPDMDGLETARRIRNVLKLEIPVIALTAHAMESEKEQAVLAGMDDYISKPFQAEQLFTCLDHHLKRFHPVNPSLQEEQKLPYSLTMLRELYQGNEIHLERTVGIFIEQMDYDLDVLRRAVAEGQFDSVRAILHKMKPNIELFGIHEASAEITELGEKCRQEDLPAMATSCEALCELITHVCQLLLQSVPARTP